MNPKWFSFSAVSLIAAIAVGLDVSNPLLKGHTDNLQKTPELTVTFTLNRIGSEIEDQKLVISKPGLVRWETPSRIVIANGTSILDFDRKAGTYTEEPQTRQSLMAVFSSDTIWAWSAVIDDAFLKPITDAKTGASRRVKNAAVKEVTVVRGSRVVTLFIDDQLGFARGATFQTESGSDKITNLVVASDIQVGKEAFPASNAAFALPLNAKKVEKSEIGLTFKDVRPILQANCNCHFVQPRGGLSLNSYGALMRGGRSGPAVVAGKPEESLMIQLATGQKAPKMPPQGSVPSDQIEKLKKWIADGAKE